jgi:hypothetical protein
VKFILSQIINQMVRRFYSTFNKTINLPMMKKITDFDLIRFIYHETGAKENTIIKMQLSENPELTNRLNLFRNSHKALGHLSKVPSTSSVDIIMDHSRNLKTKLEVSF